jgi:hypothetical protein
VDIRRNVMADIGQPEEEIIVVPVREPVKVPQPV